MILRIPSRGEGGGGHNRGELDGKKLGIETKKNNAQARVC